jgi:hypothetical protein
MAEHKTKCVIHYPNFATRNTIKYQSSIIYGKGDLAFECSTRNSQVQLCLNSILVESIVAYSQEIQFRKLEIVLALVFAEIIDS